MKKRCLFALFGLIVLLHLPSLVSARPIKFAVLSDIHYSASENDESWKMLGSGRKYLPALLKSLDKKDDIAFIIFTGDLFIDPFYPELERLREVIDANYTKPYYVLPGNHDRLMDEHRQKGIKAFTLEEFVDSFKGHPYPDSKKAHWSLDFEDYHLIALDSTMPDTWAGKISKKQLAWLKKDLRKNRNKFTIVFLHHAPNEFYQEHRLDKEFSVENSGDVRKLFLNNPQVKFVISGHYHFPAVALDEGIYYFSMPTIITYPCKYAIFSVDKDKVNYKAIPIGDNGFTERAKRGLIGKKFWRDKFDTDKELVDLFDGVSAYTFRPR